MDKTRLIRTIYLYLFSLVGLVLVIIASVRFIDMGLKAWVFTKAQQSETARQMPIRLEGFGNLSDEAVAKKILECGDSCNLDETEKEIVKEWIADYEAWSADQEKIDYVVEMRHRDASNSLAMLIVGFPLYLYHWRLATRRKEEE